MLKAASSTIHPKVREFLDRSPIPLFLAGRWTSTRRTFSTVDPSTAEILATVAEAGEAEVDQAVCAARESFETWSRTSPAERADILLRIAAALERDADIIAQIETLDNGRPYRFTRGRDVLNNVRQFRYHAGWATKLHGSTLPVSVPGRMAYTLREPVGVVGAIIPWNFPLNMATWKIAPALAAGCTVVLKPAEQTPLSALYLARLAEEAGLPQGVLSVLPGFGETAGRALVRHPGVDKIAFTGSTEVGRVIAAESAATLKRVSLELGGKSPNVVFVDADLAAAVEGSLWAIMGNSGQNCAAGSRLLVEESIYEAFMERFIAAVAELRVGEGMLPETDIGPVVSEEQFRRVAGYVRQGVQEGARLLSGDAQPELGGNRRGYFIPPTVFADARADTVVAREEIFGPVVTVTPFRDEREAIFRANDTAYGLAAGVWSRDVGRVQRFARAVRAGTVWMNGYNLFDPAAPFGGFKASGYGREMGAAVYDLYTELKTVWIEA